MADVRPFKGIRYNLDTVGRARDVIAPPYDIISAETQAQLHERHEANVVRLVLADENRAHDGAADRYDSAKRFLHEWLETGVLVRDEEPTVYLLAQDFEFYGKRTRWGFFASVKLEEYDSGVVIPHEATLDSPKADRLELMRACEANLSPVFSCYFDSDGRIREVFAGIDDGPPDLEADDEDGVNHRLWKVDDPDRMEALHKAMNEHALFIADGHHRYESALGYRDKIREKQSGADGPWERIMMYLTDFEDPGLLVLPFHRAIRHLKGWTEDEFINRLGRSFEIEEMNLDMRDMPHGGGDELIRLMSERVSDRPVFGLVMREKPRPFLLTPHEKVIRRLKEIPDPLLELDVVLLHRLALERALQIKEQDLRKGRVILYDPEWEVVFNTVFNNGWAAAFFLNRPRVEQIRDVCQAGLTMPQKSTYFYPKIPSGLVIHRLK